MTEKSSLITRRGPVATLREQASLSDHYRFFDFAFSIRSDSGIILKNFRDIFERFLTNTDEKGPSYYILRESTYSGASAIIVGDTIYTVEYPDDLTGCAYLQIMNSALSEVRSHYLFHAASLSFGESGIIFPAVSGSGKSTLTLELVKRGFNFLSDDVTAVSRSDNLLYPFPKRIGMRPFTIELCPETEIETLKHLPMIGGGEKKLLDIEDIYPGKMGGPCRMRYLIFLGHKPDVETQRTSDEELYLVLNKISEGLICDLRNVEGVKDLTLCSYVKYPVVKLLSDGRQTSLYEIEEVCLKHQTIIFDSSNGRYEKTDFNCEPELVKMPKSTAAIELLRRMKGRYKGRAADLVMNIGKFLEGVECYNLTPGRLDERADRICSIAGFQ